MMNKGKRLRVILTGMIISVLTALPVSADEKQEAESRKAEYESMKASLESRQKELQGEWDDLQRYTWEIDSRLTDASSRIYELKSQISDSQEQIVQLKKQLAEQEAEIDKQYHDMSLRIQFMYERGNKQFLSALLSADSFSDFLNQAEYVSQITTYDRQMLDKLQALKESMEAAQAELIAGKEKLEQLKSEQEEKQTELEKLLLDKQAELNQVGNQMDETDQKIYEAVSGIQEEEAYIKEIEEVERRRKAEEARKAREESIAAEQAAQQAEKQTQSGTYVEDSDINTDESSYAGNGTFIWPLPGQYHRRTSDFGYRYNPFGGGSVEYHCGDDYSAPMGTPIYAVADGTVDASGMSGTMGNRVVIYHGNGLSSVYMHASVLLVSAGQTVKQGDLIALVGATGRVTAPHLHISFRLNGEWVDPKLYIGE